MSRPADVTRASDDVYPIFSLDDTDFNHRNLSWVMRFNDVLDAAKLRDTLTTLVSIGDWKKLGGRVRRNKQGNLQVHVPRIYTDSRPGITFTHIVRNHAIEDDPTARHLPKPSETATVQPLDVDLSAFEARSDLTPKYTFDHEHDLPQLSLHVTNFDNATLVALTHPHLTTDALGLAALLKNWSLVLAGKDVEVAPLLGARSDALLAIEENAVEEPEVWNIERLRMRGINFVLWILRMLWRLAVRPAKVKKAIYLPKEYVESVSVSAQRDATALAKEKTGVTSLSETDILTAWIARILALSQSRARKITIAGALNARFRFAKLLQQGGVYVQNMVGTTMTFLSPTDARDSVGSIALLHRQCVREQNTVPQLRAQLASARRLADGKKRHLPLFGDSAAIEIKVNSMLCADFFRVVDFRAAVVKQGESTATRRNPPGTMIFFYNKLRGFGALPIDFFFMKGKDCAGNYWFIANLSPSTWELLQKEIQQA